MKKEEDLPKEFVKYLKGITAKRPKTVIDHLLKYGFITSEDLKDLYGYHHPPRAIRDVRELGIPIATYRVTGSDEKKKIAAYRFGDTNSINAKKSSGRTILSKELKQRLIEKHGNKCFILRKWKKSNYKLITECLMRSLETSVMLKN